MSSKDLAAKRRKTTRVPVDAPRKRRKHSLEQSAKVGPPPKAEPQVNSTANCSQNEKDKKDGMKDAEPTGAVPPEPKALKTFKDLVTYSSIDRSPK